MTLLLIAAILLPVRSSAQAEDLSFMNEYEIYFRFDKADIDIDYLSNRKNIASIRHYLANSHKVDSIAIYSYASPEGRQKHNQWLSEARAYAAKNILLKHSPDSSILNSGMIRICPLSENWPGLIKEVEKRYHRHDRERVLRILNNGRISDDTRKWRLGRLDGGYTWSFLRRIYMPELRVATWVCVYGEIVPPLQLPVPPQIQLEAPVKDLGILIGEGLSTVNQQPEVSKESRTSSSDKPQRAILALKTNLLLDAVTALNYAIEVPLGKHVSLQYFQTTPWWKGAGNRFCLQALTFGGEAKWWFREALTGHSLGAYGWGGNGDIQLGRKVCQQFDFWSAGLTYGYAMPIGKHLNLEFTLSAGYAAIDYQHYIPTDDFSLLVRDRNLAGTLHYIGPTKAEVSLVIPIRTSSGQKAAKKKGGKK